MSLPRQKSCLPCAKAKRRCDLGFPVCQRCITRSKVCLYPWAAPAQAGTSVIQQREMAPYSPGNGITSFQIPTAPSSVPRPLSPTLSSVLDGLMQPTSPFPTTVRTASPSHYPIAHIERPEGGVISSGSHLQARSEYAGRRLALQPFILVKDGQNAFIHHTQVGGSPALQDALAASALHAMRNPANAPLIRGEIARRVALLVAATNAAASLDQEADLLSAVQALLVYQCIRLFAREDGDISQQAQAERDEMALREWTSRLWRSLRPHGDGGSWKGWVWEESVRRAVLFAEILIGTYMFLKQGWDEAEHKVGLLGFTAQAGLWEARSATEWNSMWTRGPRLEVKLETWDRDMRDAVPEDAEELGIIVRALYLGIEALEEWLGGKRATLVTWGLRQQPADKQIGW